MRFLTIIALLASFATVACSQEKKDAPKTNPEDAMALEAPAENNFEFLPDVVAKIGDKTLTRENVVTRIRQRAAMDPQFAYLQMPNLKTKEAVKQAVLTPLINSEVMIILAQKAGFKADTATAEQLFDMQIKMFSATELEEFKEQLKTQRNITIEQFRTEYTSSPEAIERAPVMMWVEKTVKPTLTAAVEKAYNDERDSFVLASHILVTPENSGNPQEGKMPMDNTTDSAKTAAKTKLAGIHAKLKTDTDVVNAFATAAAEYSDCPSGKRGGGSLGRFGKGQMVPAFETTAFALKPGAMSEVFESPFGYHIILRATPEQEKEIIVGEVMQKEIERLVEEAKKEIKIEINI